MLFRDRIFPRLTHFPGARLLWKRIPLGSLDTRVRYGIFDRPHYAYGVFAAADQASRLGLEAITVVELGVAGGRGLVALERIAARVARRFGIAIHVAGFDSGAGMPPPTDYRDLPYVWDTGFYKMDVPALKARLAPSTELILGNIAATIPEWKPAAPLGFIAFDLDYYSSTKIAFQLFDAAPATRLPRCYCYFDDIMWPEHACHNEYTGELCAIREFNQEHGEIKLCPIHMFRQTRSHQEPWNEEIYVLHDFRHPLYTKNITHQGSRYTQLPL